MNLKQRFSFSFSFLFSAILATLLFLVYTQFAHFRRVEIQNRLKEKAQTTLKLLVEVKHVDYQLLKLIDSNTINNLYNEKILIFNDTFGLIYSSIDDAVIKWDRNLLKRVQDEDYIYMTENGYDIVGIESAYQGKVYLVLISAEDKFGNRNLVYLRYLFLAAFVIGLMLVWLLSFYLSKEALTPLDVFKGRVQNISENNLSTRIEDRGRKDEISELTRAFNTMIDRIDKSFQYQKSFVGSASHELRTPLSKISAQLENLMQNPDFPVEYIPILSSINEDTQQLSDIVTSLLILSKLEKENPSKSFVDVRIDEIIFSSADFLKKFYPDLKIHFEIINETGEEDKLEVRGDESLLKIAINNLLKNAYLYSDTKEVFIKIIQENKRINLFIENTGSTPDTKNTYELFDPFVRGSNAKQSKGFGLGLSIVKRILQYNEAEVLYNINTPNLNQIKVTFKI
jgi:two-component system sensor histidine kinase ArlS